MDFQLNETQLLIQRTFRDFVDREVKPQAEAIDENKAFPAELFKKVGELGFFGMRYPEAAGGSGLDIMSYCIACTELARGSMSLAAACCMQSLMATYFLYRFGNENLKKEYFDKALTGEKIGTICMTEPNAGSDLMAVTSIVQVKDNHFVLNGQKTWITSAPVADFFTVLAKTDTNEKLSFFFVPARFKGVNVGKSIEKLGVRGSVTSEVSFENVIIPKDHLLGEIGKGTVGLFEILAEIRVMTAALAHGVAIAAFEDSLEYAKTRTQFGKPIGKFQAIKMKFADMATQLETSKQMIYHCARLCDRKLPRDKEAAMAKLYVSECANSICDQASRIMASYGYAMEYPIQRYLRDARFTLIGGGTNELLKINIAKEYGL